MDLNTLLARVIEIGSSDLHLKDSSVPIARVDGDLQEIDDRVMAGEDLEGVLQQITEHTPAKREAFLATGELDSAYVAETIGRFRVNGFRQRGAISFAFRYVPRVVPSFRKLGLPDGLDSIAEERRGLVLITGATGAGKSTTLAAIVDHINRTRRQRIVTIEDPIEIVHDDQSCIVNQREVGLDTESFGQALRRVLRQGPDVILIGELRDEESARAALQAAESGHLVLSTMHTIDAVETITRLIELFPAAKQTMIRQVLAGTLRGAVAQRLLPKIGGGRVVAVEVMINTARVYEMIRDPIKTGLIADAIDEGSVHRMQTFSQSLVQLVLDGSVEYETAANAATNRHNFEIAAKQALKEQAAAVEGDTEAEDGAETDEEPVSHLRLS